MAKETNDEDMFAIHKLEIETMVDRAAQRGATEALTRIGLHDECAIYDIVALRDLIKVVRQLRSAVVNKIVTLIIVALGVILVMGFGKWVGNINVWGK